MKEIENKLSKLKNMDFITDLDADGQGVSESQFVLAILKHIGTLDKISDIDPWIKVLN